ncbi:hypothetical protein RG2014_010 [Delftia phage RG-2014]|uniref:Uncharacterized protein n=1 Tax=Delftia phage RG-2014 TaxID=1563661 RepID=A0A097PAJ9_9CAUD|nr:hypothetical protein RG2014_010 [Delftia phage RG-2014]AIU44264.1 hypothetical protein RG2014_010 [Delftia phage RG-2014]
MSQRIVIMSTTFFEQDTVEMALEENGTYSVYMGAAGMEEMKIADAYELYKDYVKIQLRKVFECLLQLSA